MRLNAIAAAVAASLGHLTCCWLPRRTVRIIWGYRRVMLRTADVGGAAATVKFRP